MKLPVWAYWRLLFSYLAAHCLKLDMSFHNTRTPGELIESVDGDVTLLADVFSQLVIQMGSNELLLVPKWVVNREAARSFPGATCATFE